MNFSVRGFAVAFLLLAFVPAFSQTTTTISNLPAATTPLSGAELLPCVQSGTTKSCLASSLGSGGGTPANPTATIGAAAVNGSATTYMRSDAAPALPATLPALNGSNLTNLNGSAISSGTVPVANLPVATTGANGVVKPDGSTITISGGIISATAPAGCTFANPTATIGASAVNGAATTCMRSDAAPTLPATLPALSGVNLTSLNATNLGSGTVPAARMPAFTGDVTTSAGAVANTLATVNGNVGSFTSANITVNAKGLITAAANGTGSGTVTSVATGACLTGGTITTTGTIAGTYVISARTTTTEAITSADACKLVTFSNASSVAASIAQATGGLGAGFSVDVQNLGAGTVTITPTTSTINGASTLTMAQNTGCWITSDGTNYQISACTAKLPTSAGTVTSVALSAPSNVACSVSGSPVTTTGTLTCTPAGTSGGVPYFSSSSALSSSAALASNALVIGGGAGAAPATTTTGTGVITALGNSLSAAGGVTSTIAAGTSAMGTSAISSATCATVVTTTATNTATTDTLLASFNGDPTAVTGYSPATAGMLTIIGYPSSGNVNFKVCNNTSSSITPGAITLNWRILR